MKFQDYHEFRGVMARRNKHPASQPLGRMNREDLVSAIDAYAETAFQAGRGELAPLEEPARPAGVPEEVRAARSGQGPPAGRETRPPATGNVPDTGEALRDAGGPAA